MRKTVFVLFAMLLLSAFVGCAKNKNMEIGGKNTLVEPYGMYAEFFDKSRKNPAVEYRLSTGNVVLSVVFSETIVVPLILCGWYLWEPVTNK